MKRIISINNWDEKADKRQTFRVEYKDDESGATWNAVQRTPEIKFQQFLENLVNKHNFPESKLSGVEDLVQELIMLSELDVLMAQ